MNDSISYWISGGAGSCKWVIVSVVLAELPSFQLRVVDESYIRVVDERSLRSRRDVRASDFQCQSRNSPGFNPSILACILKHRGIWGAADKVVFNKVRNLKNPKTIPLFNYHPFPWTAERWWSVAVTLFFNPVHATFLVFLLLHKQPNRWEDWVLAHARLWIWIKRRRWSTKIVDFCRLICI
jgi:hypothetical protein